MEDLRENLPHLREALRELPGAIRHLAELAATGDFNVNVQAEEIQQLRDELQRQRKQRFWLTIAATAAIVATLIFAL